MPLYAKNGKQWVAFLAPSYTGKNGNTQAAGADRIHRQRARGA
jgi:hypothetical protein